MINFPNKADKFVNLDTLSMVDQLSVMNDVWNLLFKNDTYVKKTQKDFKVNISRVLKEMIFITDWPSLRLAKKDTITGKFSYYSLGYIQREANLPRWTYYKVVNFLEKAQILYLDREDIRTVSSKRLSSKLFKTLNFFVITYRKTKLCYKLKCLHLNIFFDFMTQANTETLDFKANSLNFKSLQQSQSSLFLS